jgi:hypothetical protein
MFHFLKNYKVLVLILILTLAFSNFTHPSEIRAQDSSNKPISIGYAPGAFQLKLEPGEVFQDEIAVWSHGLDSMTLYSSITSFKQIEGFPGTSVPLYEDEITIDHLSAKDWVSGVPYKFSLKEGGENTELIQFTITVPENTSSGLYRVRISFSSDSDVDKDLDIQTRNNLLLGPAILIEVGDNLKKSLLFRDLLVNGDYTSFYTDKPIYDELPVMFTTNLYNDGETYVVPVGYIVIYNWLNQEVDRIEFNPARHSLLNDEVGSYNTEWDEESQLLGLALNNKVGFGKMQAKITLKYSTQNAAFDTLTNETSFWIIPWKILIAILVTFLVIVVMQVRKVIKKNKEKSNKK